jgi:glycosyltransferase involved in cell wall biosynthesis
VAVIPRIIYTTWISDKPLPAKFEPYIESWRRVMPDYEIRVLTLKNITRNPWVDAALAAGNNVLASNYARCQAIYETGGLYLDVDVEALKPFDDLLNDALFVGAEEPRWLGCAVFGAEAGHPFLAECMAYMDATPLDTPLVENETGPRMFTNLLQRHGWRPRNRSCMVGDIRVYDNRYFYPYLYTETFDPRCIKPETIAVHHWAYSWNPLAVTASIVIPCYNQASYLGEAIESALAQTVEPLEIIVVDDGSTDDVAGVVAPYGSRVKLIRRENGGVAAARNTGIAAAKGTYIATLDADDKLHPDYLKRLTGVGDIASAALETFGAERRQWRGKANPTCADLVAANQIMCCSLYKREMWVKLGGYDELMRDGYEDWDFWVRATHAGYKVTSLPRTLFYYRKYPENRSHRPCSVDRGHLLKGEVLAYMHAKWTALGIRIPANGNVKEEGMYINSQRVVRGGFLIAYAGEIMTDAEAKKRGLTDGAVTKIEAVKEAIAAEMVEAREAVIATAVPGGKRPSRK